MIAGKDSSTRCRASKMEITQSMMVPVADHTPNVLVAPPDARMLG